MEKKSGRFLWLICVSCMLWGCDPLTVHKVTSTILDGVPSMPPAEQYCQDYHETKMAEDKAAANKKEESGKPRTASVHPPYKEKRCDNCHDRSKESGLITSRDKLCFVCHPAIVKNNFAHGPAAVGDCLECHEPHSSAYPSLLKVEKGAVCVKCHKEKRIAEGLHVKVTEKGILCSECHNPHAGGVQFFLR